MQALIFGAGSIGRSFIGQLFAGGGYRVTFVDVNEMLVAELNRQRPLLRGGEGAAARGSVGGACLRG